MNSRPFSLLKTAFDPLFPLDSIVMFEQEGAPELAVITGNRQERYLAHTTSGKEVELTRNRLHRIPGALPATVKTIQDKVDFVKKLKSRAAEIDLTSAELWELFSGDEPKTFPEEVITEKKFSSVTPETYVAVRCALLKDRVYFKREQNGFAPRVPDIIEQLKAAEEQRASKLIHFRDTAHLLRARAKDKHIPIPESLMPIITILQDCAATVQTQDSTFHADAEDLVLLCEKEMHIEPHGRLQQRAFHILYKAGHFKKDTNISIIRHKPRIEFPDDVLREAEEITIPENIDGYVDSHIRKDFSGLNSFTIDDSSTNDMDDALSVEETEFGHRLYVHISDVAYAITPGTLLDAEALARGTSIYCPDTTVNMLPDLLCHDKLSLVVGKPRPCLSCIFDINHAFEIIHADITPSIIKVGRKYSYTEVDELLYQGERTLAFINNVAATMEQKRISQGATRITKRDAQPVLNGNEIAVIEVDEQSPARNLIGEMMVLANTVMANFLYSHSLPALYRSQESPDPSALQEIEGIPEGPARDYAERVRLKRSIVSTTPGYHATLGLNAYIQCTSPIRRYIDLVLQRQILGYMRSKATTYTADELLSLQSRIEEPLYKAMAISKESKRYWILRYLERTYKDQKKITGTVVRIDTKMPMVELNEVFIIAGARIQNAKLGAQVLLSVNTVDPRSDYLRLDEVRKNNSRN